MKNFERIRFYNLFKPIFESHGYQYFDEHIIKTKGRYRKKPDFIAIDQKRKICIIGEIKTIKENPLMPGWRQIQKSDTFEFARLREIISEKERKRQIKKEIGGHIIILLGQIVDYFRCLGKTYLSPVDLREFKFLFAYCLPSTEARNVEEAINIAGIKLINKIYQSKENNQETSVMVYIYELPYIIKNFDKTDFPIIQIDISQQLKRVLS